VRSNPLFLVRQYIFFKTRQPLCGGSRKDKNVHANNPESTGYTNEFPAVQPFAAAEDGV
jgi:hypothetical protein